MVGRNRGPRKRPIEPHGRGYARVGTSNLGGREGKQQGQVPLGNGSAVEGAKTIGTSACKDSELGPGQRGTSARHKCQKREQTKSKRTTNVKHEKEQKIKSKRTETTNKTKKKETKKQRKRPKSNRQRNSEVEQASPAER